MADQFELEDVQVALSPMERFEEYLQTRGMRMTQQRRVIVEEVFSHHDHFDADDLLANLRNTGAAGSKVSRPTVYRALTELVDAGLLRKMTLAKRSVYEHDYGYPQHDHLYCQKCNKLIEFHSDKINEIRDSVAREHRFRVTGHRLIITGICEECNRPPQRDRRLDLV